MVKNYHDAVQDGIPGKYHKNTSNDIEEFQRNSSEDVHVEAPKGLSLPAAAAQLSNVMLGVGSLMMPMGFRSLGLITTPFAIAIVAAITYFSLRSVCFVGNYFVEKNGMPDRPFPKIAELALSTILPNSRIPWIFGVSVGVLIVLNMISVLIIYVTVISGNWKKSLDIIFGTEINRQLVIAAQFPVVAMLCSVKTQRKLTPFSLIGSSCIWIGVGLVLVFIIRELSVKGVKEVELVNNFEQLPTFLSIVVFNFGATTCVVPIQVAMTNPKKMYGFFSVISIATMYTTAFHLTVGSLGYIAYGSNTQPQIDHNLPEGSSVAAVLPILVAIGVTFTFPALFLVTIQQIIAWFKNPPPPFFEAILRYGLVFALFLVPMITADLVKVLQLITTLLSLLQYVVPVFMVIPTFWYLWTPKRRFFEIILGLALIIFGLGSFFSGIYANV